MENNILLIFLNCQLSSVFVASVKSCLWSILGNLQTEKLLHIVLSTSRQEPRNVSSPYLAQADFGIPGVAGDVNAV